MRALRVAAFAIGIGVIFVSQGTAQPEKGVVQSESASHTYKFAESEKYQQASDVTTFQAQEQHTQTLNSAECLKQGEIDIERKIGRYTGWLVLVGAVQFVALIVQAVVFIFTLRQMQETDQRQLRAYVVCESGIIFNVANPIVLFPGQDLPQTEARITNLAVGPGVRIQIKNTGQTPAFQVQHWGYICFREFPLVAALPTRLPGMTPVASVLGPGIPSTKLLWLAQPLTAQEISQLRAGTGAVYVYGEITYRDAFDKLRRTSYRSMYHPLGGAIGVSTDLSFCEEGNEAT